MNPDAPTITRYSKNGKSRAGDEVYATLKSEILNGKIGSGELLSENEIAKRFSISRTPVREALNKLACEGLTEVLPQRGHQVRTISFSEIVEAFHLREMLEVEAIGEAARRITDEDLAHLKGIIESVGENVGNTIMANYLFHTSIARISGNRLLAEFVEELLMRMQRLLIDTPTLFDPNPELGIIEVLSRRDPEAARQVMQEHLQDTRDQLLGVFSQYRERKA